MARDPLQTVLRLRRMDLDSCRAELVHKDTRAHEAAIVVQAAEARIQAEMAAASRLSASDAAVEAFGAWLPKGREAVAHAIAVLERAQQDAAQARALLNLARAAAEAVERMLEQKAVDATREELRVQQVSLDEVGLRQRPKPAG
jgi:flagellar export protein FliJ